MKAFSNITLREVCIARAELAKMPNAICAEFYPEYVNWEAVSEYIFEHYGQWHIDKDDIDFIYDNVWFDGETHNIYVLEVQEDDKGVEHLFIETLHNPRC